MVRRTEYQEEVRPRWMQPLNLKVVLMSGQHGEPPTCEPIHLTLLDGRGTGNVEIATATCVYTLMRKKDTLGEWEPYDLSPQWIRLFGGPYGGKPVAEVLVAFELMMWKSREDPALIPREMWPQPEENYVEDVHFSKLRRATLHFALMGLRDIPKLPRLASVGAASGMQHVDSPEVRVSCPSWYNKEFDDRGKEEDEKTFVYVDCVPGGDKRLKESQLKKWKSKKGLYAQNTTFGADPEMMNFEFLSVGKLSIEIPDKQILQPYIRIQAYDNSGVLFGKSLIGESLQSLAHSLPCCWYPNVDLTKSHAEQKDLIENAVKKAHHEAGVREHFQQMSKEEYEEFLKQERKEKFEAQMAQQKHLVKLDAERPARIDNFGLPLELKLSEDHKRPLLLSNPVSLNMQTERGFSPRIGRDVKEDAAGFTCRGKLEYHEYFQSSMWFQNYPLLRNRDMVGALSNSYDWNFGDHRGFLKCAYKLVDDWEEEKEEGEDEADKKEDEEEEEDKQPTDEEMLKQTFGLDPEMAKYVFHKEKFVQKWKSTEEVPSRVRVRVYMLKAICIWAKGSGFAEPYIELQLGQSNSISMKNVRCGETNTPDFGLFEERDVELPMDGRLEISIMDANDLSVTGDTLIGSTVIDLEDRWHCKKWNKLNQRQIVPYESRNFYQPGSPAQNFGAIEMLIEMLDSSEASDKKPSVMPKLAGTLVDLRIVIRTAEVMTLGEDELMDVQIGCALMCDKYEGPYPTKQVTDVHYGSSGPCKYDWRVVYPQIRSPILSCIVEVSLYKFAQIAGNTLLGSVRLDMKRYVERVADTMDKIELPPVPLKMQGGPNDDPDEDIGTVTLEASVLSYAEALEKKAGIAREPPNQYPALFAPTEGRGWDAFFAGFSIPWPSWWKKLIPLIIAAVMFLISVVVMRQMGLL